MIERAFYLYVETGYADKANELRDFIKDNCIAFSTSMHGSKTKVFIDRGLTVKNIPTDLEINIMVKLIADKFNLDVDGYILEHNFDNNNESVGHIIDGTIQWTNIDAFRFGWSCLAELRQALQTANHVRRPHLEWLCPECKEVHEVHINDCFINFVTAPLIAVDKNTIDIDWDDFDIEADWQVVCSHCGCPLAESVEAFQDMYFNAKKKEMEKDMPPKFLDEALDAFMDSMQVAYTPGTAQYVYKHPIEEINLTV